jgi:hypothetical protein
MALASLIPNQTQMNQLEVSVGGKLFEFAGDPKTFDVEYGQPVVEDRRLFFGREIQSVSNATDYSGQGFSVTLTKTKNITYTFLDLDAALKSTMGRIDFCNGTFEGSESQYKRIKMVGAIATITSAGNADTVTITFKGQITDIIS